MGWSYMRVSSARAIISSAMHFACLCIGLLYTVHWLLTCKLTWLIWLSTNRMTVYIELGFPNKVVSKFYPTLQQERQNHLPTGNASIIDPHFYNSLLNFILYCHVNMPISLWDKILAQINFQSQTPNLHITGSLLHSRNIT